MIYNPYRNYDKGMDDSYCGKEPSQNNRQYLEGYYYAQQLEREEENNIREAEQKLNPSNEQTRQP